MSGKSTHGGVRSKPTGVTGSKPSLRANGTKRFKDAAVSPGQV